MNPAEPPEAGDPRLQKLSQLETSDEKRAYLAEHPDLVCREVVEQLAERVRQLLRVDVEEALRNALAAVAIAEVLGEGESLGRALRAQANALWFKGQYRPAVDLFDRAIKLFEEARRDDEVGRTLSTSIQPLILLGEYERALRNADRARGIFAKQNDQLRLARLEINVANIHHRQERFAEALAAYESAYEQLLPLADTEGIGVAMHNMAVCLISLNEFDRALGIYERACGYCRSHDMPRLASQADYNIAYLYFLRGEYQRAIEGLRAARETCSKNGDDYHAALCPLDLSEIYLDLNLIEEAAEMAQDAACRFEKLGVGYEAGRALTNLGIATSHQGHLAEAVELFDRARETFARDKHRAGEALVDLYRAILLYETGDFTGAKKFCEQAREFFEATGLARKEVVCELLFSRLALAENDLPSALSRAQRAVSRLATLDAPLLSYQACYQLGRVHDAAHDPVKSRDAYQTARLQLETLRSSLQGEELRIVFMKNKLGVYEQLVRIALEGGVTGASAEEAFGYMEDAKSRSLMDAIFGRAQPLPARSISDKHTEDEVRRLRGELNWYYHRIELEHVREEGVSAERIGGLRVQARAREDALLRAIREAPEQSVEKDALCTTSTASLERIRAALDPGTVLIEYFQTGDQLLAAVVTREALEIVPLTTMHRVRSRLRMLRFQLSKFRLGPDYFAKFETALKEATDRHLEELYEDLIAPLDGLIKEGDHLVLVPHGALHYVPLHALYDGSDYVIDQFTVSYCPSASLYALRRGDANSDGGSLILGVHDSRTPWIVAEVEEVASVVHSPRVLMGEEASAGSLRDLGARSRQIHIATHGYFRADNPMFSSVRLGDSYLSLYDLYNLRLPVDLFTLSGCATGLNVVAGGDELLGLVRGLLYAGARTLLLSLWDVHDQSTAEFMRSFYVHLDRGKTKKAAALKSAMCEIRKRYPHPFHWAPFMLVGESS